VTLKKPGDFFKTEDKNKVKMYSQSTSLPESYDEYKSNLKNIEVLADFTESVGTFKENAERINTLSTEIQNLQEQLSQFIKQEDLDRSTVSHLLFVEENIENIQQKIKGINSKTLHNIKEEFRGLQETVSEFIRLEVPSYKKQILETERRTDIRFIDLKNQIQKEVTSIDSHLTEKLSLISDTIENDYQNQIQNIHSLVKDFTEQEIPRYRGLITESKLQVEKDFITLEESIQNKIEEIDKSVSLAIEKSKEQNESNDKQLIELQQIIEDSRSQIDTISRTYENLHKDFRNREAHENQKLESYEGLLNNFSEKIDALENNLNDNVSLLHNDLNISTSKYYDILKKEVGSFEENISNKVKDLEVNIVVNEKHIHRIKDSVYEILDGLKLDLIEEKSQELTEKISHVERILEQFNERTLLNEGLLNEPPNVETSDPLTPLDQNYVTLPQLQEHYRIFINRIQQQLSTLGGGGAVRLDDLDDVDRTSAKTDGYVLAYQASTGKFIGTAVSGGGGGSQTLDTTLGLGNISSLGMSVGVVTATSFSGNINSSGISTLNNVVVGGATTALIVSGNARITGILTIGTSSITLDGTTDKITVGSGLTITSSEILIGSNIIDSGGLSGNASSATFATTAGIATFATTAGISTVSEGLTGTPNITVGVTTATSFVKSGGTSSQFLKADGSVDSSTYLTSYTETDTLNSVTGRGNSTANGISVGVLTATTGNYSGIVTSSGAIISGTTTAASFVKSGGTSSQFLKADGSVDISTYLTTTGSGTNLTGIVTSIVAGTNVTISGSTGQVTINATGGGGSTLGVATAGGTVGTGVTLLDFRGAGISTVTVSSGIATINIEGGGSSTPEISSVMMSMIF
jgi:hypothetical protein